MEFWFDLNDLFKKGVIQSSNIVTCEIDNEAVKELAKYTELTKRYNSDIIEINDDLTKREILYDKLKAIVYKKLNSNKTVRITLNNVKTAIKQTEKELNKINTVTCKYCKQKFDKRKTKYKYIYRYSNTEYYHKKCYEKYQAEINTATCEYCKQKFDKRNSNYEKFCSNECYEKYEQEQKEKQKQQEIQKLKNKIKQYEEKAEFCKKHNLEIQQKRALDKIKLLKTLITVKEYNYKEFHSNEDDNYIKIEEYSNDIPHRCLQELQRFKEVAQKLKDVTVSYYVVEQYYNNDPCIVAVIKTEFYETEILISEW